MEMFEPHVDENDRFAVAVPARTFVVPIMSYTTEEKLLQGYRDWRAHAQKNGITLPLPIEYIGEKNGRSRPCKIRNDLVLIVDGERTAN